MDAYNQAQIFGNFEKIFDVQINILFVIKKSPNLLRSELDKSNKAETASIRGTQVELEDALVMAIYEQILKNPSLYHKKYRSLTPARRKSVLGRDKNVCQICQNEFPLAELEIDHIFPYALGGSHLEPNLMAICKQCNNDKGKKLEYYYHEGKKKLLDNIRTIAQSMPIIKDFGNWIKSLVENTGKKIVDLWDRADYMEFVLKSLKNAKKSAYLSLNTLNPSEGSETVKQLQFELMTLRQNKGDIRILYPEGKERLLGGYEIAEIRHIPIKFLDFLNQCDLRFTLIDNEISIFVQNLNDSTQPSNNGIVVSSEKLNAILREYFLTLWNQKDALTYFNYLRKEIKKANR